MKILYLIRTMNLGGAEKFTLSLASFFAANGDDVTILSSGGRYVERYTSMGIHFVNNSLMDPGGISQYPLLRKALEQIISNNSFDIIHCQQRVHLFLLNSIGIDKRRIVYTANNYFNDFFQKLIYPGYAVGISPAVTEGLRKTIRTDHQNIFNINYGVTVSSGPEMYYNDNFTFGYAGRIIPEKGVFTLLQVFSELAEKYKNIYLIFRGEGESIPNLQKYIDEKKLAGKVKIDKPSDEADKIYNDIDCLVYATKMEEGLPISILEAGGRGKIVIAVNSGATGDVIENGTTGILLPSSNFDLLLDSMSAVLERKDEFRMMGEGLRVKIMREYNSEKMLEQYKSLYQRVINII